ncbi:MAG: glucosaminidase domain-containing protein [Helicobacteraceae bacterium]|jgi:N-acetylmuramoyl-L-alanine amidase|nr:glucosaminidase domain-containing protein [Helicobacteraceae bacterium]
MRSVIATLFLVCSLCGEEFVRLDLPISKPFNGALRVPAPQKKIYQKIAYDASFLELAKAYADAPIEYERLKAVTLAMMMLESGRGSSDLAKKFNNFGGLKYRQEMVSIAQKIRYKASDGYDYYCEFGSINDFIVGFWAFLDRKPYEGWRKKAFSEKAFLEFIAPIYCPLNKEYVAQVTSLLPEARALLDQQKRESSRFAMTSQTEGL